MVTAELEPAVLVGIQTGGNPALVRLRETDIKCTR